MALIRALHEFYSEEGEEEEAPERRLRDDYFQVCGWLPLIIEIACKLKGYKADVECLSLLRAGSSFAGIDSNNITVVES